MTEPVAVPSVFAAPLHAETVEAIGSLRRQYPETPFLTLGQTVLWDEPVKAAFCRLLMTLEQQGRIPAGGRMVAGVHDTDYFAKLSGLAVRDTPFVLLRHNDGDTRGLWSAAGEISALFGAEVVPSRPDLARNGVSFSMAASVYPGGAEALLNQETEAPLWRAIVHTEPHQLLAADVKLGEIAPALIQQIRWAFRQTLRGVGCPEDFESDVPCASRQVARDIKGWVEGFLAEHPNCTLSDLYRDLIPKIWALTGGEGAVPSETTTSVELFRFNGETATLPRFRFVDVFLNPATRELARRCYDDAVRGSGIYTLDQFGPGALPFDVVVPGHGRGTLRLHEGSVIIETEEPVELCEMCDPDSVSSLAAILERRLGPGVALVGKAVALISMLAAEFIFVFHEKASSYTSRTAKMNTALRQAGVQLDLHPMLRVKLGAWNALSGAVEGNFYLPSYLQRAFGDEKVPIQEFAASWQRVREEQDTRRAELAACHTPTSLMRYLAQHGEPIWTEKEQAYTAAQGALQMILERVAPVDAEIADLRARQRALRAEAVALERSKGEQYRTGVAPLRDRIADLLNAANERTQPLDEQGKPRKWTREERAQLALLEKAEFEEVQALRKHIEDLESHRAGMEDKIQQLHAEARALGRQARAAVVRKLELERCPEAVTARAAMRRLQSEAELQKLYLVRDSILVSEGLYYTNYRPTAWWFPMVSPDGKWFRQLAEQAQARIEIL